MYRIDIFLPVLIGPHLKHKFFIAMTLMFGFIGLAMSDTVSPAQRMFNQLCHNAGPADGAYGDKTRTGLGSIGWCWVPNQSEPPEATTLFIVSY